MNIPHFDMPFRFDQTATGTVQAATVEQDSLAEVYNSVAAMIRTPLGSRIDQPDYGIEDLTFTHGNLPVSAIEQRIMEWEPRADIIIGDDTLTVDELSQKLNLRIGRIPPPNVPEPQPPAFLEDTLG